MKILKKNKKIWLTFVLLFTIFNFSPIVNAIPDGWESYKTPSFRQIKNPTTIDSDTSIPELITVVINGILKLAIPFLVLAFIYVGFLFVKAQGNPEELKKVRQYFIWIVVGAAIILGANLILEVVANTLSEASLTS